MYAVGAKYVVLNGKEGEKKGGQKKVGKKEKRTRVDLTLLNSFTRRNEEIFNVVACLVRSREGTALQCSVCISRQASTAQCRSLFMTYSYQRESDLFSIFCTGRAELCMCYGPYVETC